MTEFAVLFRDHDEEALIHMLHVMYPHEGFPRGPYERTAHAIFTAVAGSPRRQAQLRQGLDDLDQMRAVPFVELDEATALTVLRGVQDAPFFVDVLSVAGVAFYDDHEVWELLGYEGPSFGKGGYLHRGFADLDWLPEPEIVDADEDELVTGEET